jgi:hypothetical protein
MRFRLITLVALVTVAAAFCGTIYWSVIEPTFRRERAIAAIKELGGEVDYASPSMKPAPNIPMPWFRHEYRKSPRVIGPDWAVRLLGERYFLSPVTRVEYLRNTRPLTEEDFAILQDLPGLQMLDLTHFGKPASLGNIGCPEITDAAIPHIIKLQNLQFLLLVNSKVTDEGVVTLCDNLPKLKWIQLSGTPITDVSLEALAELPDLKSLDVQETNVTLEGVRRFDRRHPYTAFTQSVDPMLRPFQFSSGYRPE